MGIEAQRTSIKRVKIGGRPASRWMHPHLLMSGILASKGMPPSSKFEPSFCFSQASARAAYQVAADVRLVHRSSAAWTR